MGGAAEIRVLGAASLVELGWACQEERDRWTTVKRAGGETSQRAECQNWTDRCVACALVLAWRWLRPWVTVGRHQNPATTSKGATPEEERKGNQDELASVNIQHADG